MHQVWAKRALTPDGWASDVLVEIGPDGRIADVRAGEKACGVQTDILLPAPVNAHSHGFQRAMAGLTEGRGPDPKDNFWTWRQLMYRFIGQLTPEDVGAIAALVQMEMLQAGYATNTEFHYLHHQPDGSSYDDPAEMSARIVAAARETGIGLTLLPVHYQFGGCDGRALGGGQLRFGTDMDRFRQVLDGAERAIRQGSKDMVLGVAPHSLRAVSSENLREMAGLRPGAPVHLHLAEQVPEVEEVMAHWGARPVEWLLDNVVVDERWCLIHCTQMLARETAGLAATGAVAGLCPITEANLGDGIFDGPGWLAASGRIAIGSDSNVRITLAEELRLLEYSQRLQERGRAIFAAPGISTGRRLFDMVLAGGAQAAGRETGALQPGKLADLVSLDGGSLHFAGLDGDQLLDAFIFAADDRVVENVWSAGRHVVVDGRHIRHDAIVGRYRDVLNKLSSEL